MTKTSFAGLIQQDQLETERDPTVSKMTIICRDLGEGILQPEISFDPVGKITQGWFDRHVQHFLRQIQQAQVAQRREFTK